MKSSFYEREADTAGYIALIKDSVGKNGGRVFPHFHDSIEISVIFGGIFRVKIGGEEQTISEGGIVFADRFCPHSYFTDGFSEKYTVVINSSHLNKIEILKKKSFPKFFTCGKAFENIKLLLQKTYEYKEGANALVMKGFADMFLGILLDNCDMVDKEGGNEEIPTKALIYINENYAENICLKSISEKFGYTENYFSKLFNDYTGMNLREYINRKRISEFNRMKEENPKLAAYKIALLCGFDNENTFYRALKKYSEQ